MRKAGRLSSYGELIYLYLRWNSEIQAGRTPGLFFFLPSYIYIWWPCWWLRWPRELGDRAFPKAGPKSKPRKALTDSSSRFFFFLFSFIFGTGRTPVLFLLTDSPSCNSKGNIWRWQYFGSLLLCAYSRDLIYLDLRWNSEIYGAALLSTGAGEKKKKKGIIVPSAVLFFRMHPSGGNANGKSKF